MYGEVHVIVHLLCVSVYIGVTEVEISGGCM